MYNNVQAIPRKFIDRFYINSPIHALCMITRCNEGNKICNSHDHKTLGSQSAEPGSIPGQGRTILIFFRKFVNFFFKRSGV